MLPSLTFKPKTMKVATKEKINTFGDWAYLAVEKHFHKTIKHEEDVLKDKEPEALHQMRVGMRRLRTAVTGFAPALNLPKHAQEKKIGKIARILGTLRDLDVLKEALEERYKPALPKSEQKVLNKALDYLVSQREQTFKVVKETLSEKSEKSDYQKFKQSMGEWLKNPKYTEMAQLPILEVLPDLLLPQVSELLLHPAWMVGTKAEERGIEPIKDLDRKAVEERLAAQGEVMHDLRKQAKRVRYQMELFTDFYGAKYGEYYQDVKKIQEILGQIQDSAVLGEFLSEALQSQKNGIPPTLADQLAESCYQAWQEWQVFQTRYLNPQIRQSFHSELLRPTGVPE